MAKLLAIPCSSQPQSPWCREREGQIGRAPVCEESPELNGTSQPEWGERAR